MDKRFQAAYNKLVDNALKRTSDRTRVEKAVSLFYCKKCSEVKTLTFKIDNEDLKDQLIADINPSTHEAFKAGCTDCGGALEYLGHVVFTVVIVVKGSEVHRMFVAMNKEFRQEKQLRIWSMILKDDKIELTETEDEFFQNMVGRFRDVVDESVFKRDDARFWV